MNINDYAFNATKVVPMHTAFPVASPYLMTKNQLLEVGNAALNVGFPYVVFAIVLFLYYFVRCTRNMATEPPRSIKDPSVHSESIEALSADLPPI
ncbi:unnamed protein product [Cylicocyclus nassatus]|uniref:Uncharacterized protein n=1 Tax=Cylicocyclus nassatus TaxID=53992 RepID=A0AA36M1Z2_CYLNA|nr:unnamed protein product [Cylicocyclus nassatus]